MFLLNCSNVQITNKYRYISGSAWQLAVNGRRHSVGHNNNIVFNNLKMYVIKIKKRSFVTE